jgi:hypothetical protein
MVSSNPQNSQPVDRTQPFLVKLSLARMLFFTTNHMKTLTLRGTLSFHVFFSQLDYSHFPYLHNGNTKFLKENKRRMERKGNRRKTFGRKIASISASKEQLPACFSTNYTRTSLKNYRML